MVSVSKNTFPQQLVHTRYNAKNIVSTHDHFIYQVLVTWVLSIEVCLIGGQKGLMHQRGSVYHSVAVVNNGV